MIRLNKLGLIFFLLLFGGNLEAQFLKRNINKLDDNGKRKGLWISYWDDEKRIPMSLTHYKEGRECDVSKEFHMNGNLRLKFRYGKEKIRVKYYDNDRKLEQKGWAVLDYNEQDTHYYWQGEWKYYNSKRKLQKISYYEHGEEISHVDY